VSAADAVDQVVTSCQPLLQRAISASARSQLTLSEQVGLFKLLNKLPDSKEQAAVSYEDILDDFDNNEINTDRETKLDASFLSFKSSRLSYWIQHAHVTISGFRHYTCKIRSSLFMACMDKHQRFKVNPIN